MIGWSYPHFWEWDSPAFVARAFIDSMPKAVVSRNATGIVLSFCPRLRRPPYVSGEIQLASDTTIAAVRWFFVTQGAKVESGGLALFGARGTVTERAHLLPTNAITWVRVAGTSVFETTEYAFGQWTVAELGESIRAIPP